MMNKANAQALEELNRGWFKQHKDLSTAELLGRGLIDPEDVEWVERLRAEAVSPLDENLKALLKFIQGVRLYWGAGMTTYPGKEEKQALHDDCLRLEAAGLLHRHYEDDKIVVWMPVGEAG